MRAGRRWSRPLTLATLLALAACSGGSESPLPFAARANDACAQIRRQLRAVPQPTASTPAEVDRYLQQSAEVSERGTERLRQLSPPEDLIDELDELVGSSEEATQGLRSAADAMRRSNQKEFDEATQEIRRAQDRFKAIAAQLSLDECVGDPTPGPSASR